MSVLITSYLTTTNNVGRLREHVNDFPLAFVAPLRADDDRHLVERLDSGAFGLRHSIDTGTRRHVVGNVDQWFAPFSWQVDFCACCHTAE